MVKPGRPSYTPDDRVPYGTPSRRLRPPKTLVGPEREAFVTLVAASPQGQFVAGDMDLLISWCEATVLARQAAGELTAAGGPVQQDGKTNPWFPIWRDCVKTLSALAIRLRLSPQGRNPTARASKKTVAQLSYYEEMALQESADDEAQPN